jgi:hypothetical protein
MGFISMKKTLIFFSCLLFCNCTKSIAQSSYILTLPEAEKIMGEPMKLNDSSSSYANGIHSFQCSYFGFVKDSATGFEGRLYYMYEDYDKESEAHKVYEGFRISNEKNSPLKNFAVADEGYYQVPPGPPPFILARKGTRLYRFKINKSTINSSVERLLEVASEKVR